jgi:hypothetical protein
VVCSWKFNSWATLHGPASSITFRRGVSLKAGNDSWWQNERRVFRIHFCFMIFALKPHKAWVVALLKEICQWLQEQTCTLKIDVFSWHTRRCSYRIFVQYQWTRCIASGYAASIRVKPYLLSSYGSLAFVYAQRMSQLSSFHRRLILYTALRRVQLNPDRYEAVRQTVLWQGHLDDFFIAYRHFNWILSVLIKSLTELWNASWTSVLRHSEFQAQSFSWLSW